MYQIHGLIDHDVNYNIIISSYNAESNATKYQLLHLCSCRVSETKNLKPQHCLNSKKRGLSTCLLRENKS